jgi:hypothetical protein
VTKPDQLEAAQHALGAHNAKVKALDVATLIDQSFVKKAVGQKSTN